MQSPLTTPVGLLIVMAVVPPPLLALADARKAIPPDGGAPGVALACVELALSPVAFTAVAT